MAELQEFAAGAHHSGRQRWLRLIIGIGVSALSLAWFIGVADRSALSRAWETLSPEMFVAASAMFFANLAIRAVRLILLSSDRGSFAGFLPWLRLSVVHQAAFMVLPSGFGDLGFPMLAKRIVGVAGTRAARTVLIYRLQDAWVLLMIGILGVTLMSVQIDRQPVLVVAIVLLTGAGLVWSADLARWAAIAIARMLSCLVLVLKNQRFARIYQSLTDFAESVAQPIATRHRLLTALAAVGCWSAAAASAWVIFDMIGTGLEPVEILVIVAGLNLAGAFASFTIAGFGISEGGLAGALLLLGYGAAEAVAIALVARPLLLINALFVCGVVECAVRLVRWRTR
jgi:uncharacterized protein (TIRG00374 family)